MINDTDKIMKSISTMIIILILCMLQGTGMTVAQEEKANQSDAQQQEASAEDQGENKDIPTITNPVIFNEKDLDKLKDKQREYMQKHYPDYSIRIECEEVDYFDGRRYSKFELKNEKEEWIIVRFDIEEAHQAYMKKHQKKIEREAKKLIKQGIINIE